MAPGPPLHPSGCHKDGSVVLGAAGPFAEQQLLSAIGTSRIALAPPPKQGSQGQR